MKKYYSVITIALLITMVISGCCLQKEGILSSPKNYDNSLSGESSSDLSWRAYDGKKLGILTGTLLENIASENFPNSEYLYFDSYPDLSTALLTGKIDAFLADEPNIRIMQNEQPKLSYIKEKITSQDVSFAFSKDKVALCEEFNEFLKELRADGRLAEIDEIWMGSDESKKNVDMSDLRGENGRIRVVTTATDMPWSYIKDGNNVGYDIDIVVNFCRDRGYALELLDADFSGRIPSVQSGRCDFCTGMNVTEERKEQVLFSDPTYKGGVVLVVPSEGSVSEGKSFFERVSESFYKTFIKEGRYKLFIEGMVRTLIITLSSIFLGTVLGFVIFMGCLREKRIANILSGFFVWLIQGMPVVVLLMILYYIIFAKARFSGTLVAVIAFTLVFGAGFFGMLKMGVAAVDKGQREAALALGYGDIHLFFRIILPQALPHFLPSYRGEVVALIKATAIVGYIAVQDLTKMGDIVRGRTYDAFFPLIAVAVIYFILGGLLRFTVARIEKLVDPKRRKKEKIVKGVKSRDRD